MKPIDEKGWAVLKGSDDVADLSTFRGDDTAIYSLWRPSLAERFRLMIGVPVVVGVLSHRHPPITVLVGRENIPGLKVSSSFSEGTEKKGGLNNTPSAPRPKISPVGQGLNLLLLATIVSSSACTPSKYAVVAPPAEEHQQITLNGEALVSIKKDGSWLWRKSPEDVTKLLVTFAGEVSKLHMACEAELAKLKPAKAKPAPRAAAKVKK